MIIKSAKDLDVYKKAYALAMKIFEISKNFPKEEKYSLTSQSDVHPDQFVLIFERPGQRGVMKHILLIN